MRKLKFRCWYDCDKSMTYETCPCKNESGIVMQFTGLLDKSGREIYKGDIVRVFFSAYAPNDIHIIKWQECSAQFVGEMVEKNPHSEYHQSRIINLYQNQSCEVIGNIYENPELLEVK